MPREGGRSALKRFKCSSGRLGKVQMRRGETGKRGGAK